MPINKNKVQISEFDNQAIDSFQELIMNIHALHDSEEGCPWHKKQTHKTLIPFLIEESNELIDALLSEDKKNILYAKFRGIIATGRVFRKEDKKGFLTFITIASDDGVYHDLVIYGAKKVSKMVCISGYGKVKDDGCCRYIDVLKFTSDRL